MRQKFSFPKSYKRGSKANTMYLITCVEGKRYNDDGGGGGGGYITTTNTLVNTFYFVRLIPQGVI